MAKNYVLVLEVSNVTEEQIQTGLGELFVEFCDKHKDAGIITSVLNEEGAQDILKVLYEEDY